MPGLPNTEVFNMITLDSVGVISKNIVRKPFIYVGKQTTNVEFHTPRTLYVTEIFPGEDCRLGLHKVNTRLEDIER